MEYLINDMPFWLSRVAVTDINRGYPGDGITIGDLAQSISESGAVMTQKLMQARK
jgi:hypothetical protein